MSVELFGILGVTPRASAQEIRSAYKEKAKKLHPDKPGGCQEAFQRVQRAYETLSDDATRERLSAAAAGAAFARTAADGPHFGFAKRTGHSASREAAPPRGCNVSDILRRDAEMMGLGRGEVRGGARELLRRRQASQQSLAHLLREQAVQLGRGGTKAPKPPSPRHDSPPRARSPIRPEKSFEMPCQQGGRGSAMRRVYDRLLAGDPRFALEEELRWRAAFETLSATEEDRRQRILQGMLGNLKVTDELRYRAFVQATSEVLRGRQREDRSEQAPRPDNSVRSAWLNQHRKQRVQEKDILEPDPVLDAAAVAACSAQAAAYRDQLMCDWRRKRGIPDPEE